MAEWLTIIAELTASVDKLSPNRQILAQFSVHCNELSFGELEVYQRADGFTNHTEQLVCPNVPLKHL